MIGFALPLAVLLLAQASVPTAPADPRIQQVAFNPDQVTVLPVAYGYAAVVELAADERIENVVVGNSAVWQITENGRGDRVIVKPLASATPTNMVILTDLRRYVFALEPSSGETSFVVRFHYPRPAVRQVASVATTATYRLSGDRAIFPASMQDDGTRTTIRWSRQTPLPAVFALSHSGESLVNSRVIGDSLVIEGIATRYRLRYGKAEATATRKPVRPRK